MEKCDSCGNQYDKCFEIKHDGSSYHFDCFECAINSLAPQCETCQCRIIGHGVEENDSIYCCVHCAKQEHSTELKDRS